MKEFKLMMGLSKKNAFEGWFVKLDDKASELLLSVIIGYATGDDPHAFIQVQHNKSHQTIYKRYDLSEVKTRDYPFVLEVGPNRLSEKAMSLDLEELSLHLKFGDFQTIKKRFLRPNIMGVLSYLPNQCNHAIISMNHRVTGSVILEGEHYSLEQAKGYIEKDWGTSFPDYYVWAQANPWIDSSVAFSYASVPTLGRHATGFFLLIHHQGDEYRFSSIEGTKLVTFSHSDKGFNVELKKGKKKIVLETEQHHPLGLASPRQGSMSRTIKESLDGSMILQVYQGDDLIINLETERASIDVAMH